MSDWKNVQYKDGKMRTSEDGGGGTVTDVQVDGVSVVNQQGVAEIETPNADGIEYDNQQSGLQATNMQDAIDELAQGSGGGGVEDVEVNGTSVVNAQNVAEIKSYKEVTQAEYQALPSSKLTDNILYCIKDSAGADGFPPLIYSDEEREVGVWRDGKPLYQRTLYLEYSYTEDYNISNPILNIDNVVNAKGYVHIGPDGSGEYANPWFTSPYIVSTSNFASISASKSTIRIVSKGWGSTKARVTLQYTKTTDTAGSGTWTTQGVYAHHYSTTEHVIGTWIDGKPLYEKTFSSTTGNNYSTAVFMADTGDNTIIRNFYGLMGDARPLNSYIDNSSKTTTWVAADKHRIANFSLGTFANLAGKITVQYTKTTD